MVGLLLQGTAVGKNPPTGVGAIAAGSRVEVGLGPGSPPAGGVWVAVELGTPPLGCVAAGGTVGGGTDVRVGMVWAASRLQTVFAYLALNPMLRHKTSMMKIAVYFLLFINIIQVGEFHPMTWASCAIFVLT
jgi:hypothetical protein